MSFNYVNFCLKVLSFMVFLHVKKNLELDFSINYLDQPYFGNFFSSLYNRTIVANLAATKMNGMQICEVNMFEVYTVLDLC